MLPPWLRNWLPRTLPSARSHRPQWRSRKPRPDLRVESMEARLTPAVDMWTGLGTPTASGALVWSDGGNWASGVAPQNGDDLVFAAGPANLASQDDIVGLSINSISITGTGYSLDGTTSLTLGSGGISVGSAVTASIGLPLDVANSSTAIGVVSGSSLTINGAITTSGGSGSLLVNGGGDLELDGTDPIAISLTAGILSGSGSLGAITATGGTIDPGPDGVVGTLTANSLDLSGGGNLTVEVTGFATAGTDYDQLIVTNGLTLGGTSSFTIDLNGVTTGGTAAGVVTYATAGGGFGSVQAVNKSTDLAIRVVEGNTALDVQVDQLAASLAAGPITEGAAQTVATFTDTNTALTTGDFTATIDWGDGNGVVAATILAGSAPGSFVVQSSHEEGNFTPIVTITESTAIVPGSVTATGALAVNDALLSDTSTPATASGVEGSTTATLTVASFTDANTTAPTTDFTATIHWGDGQTSSGTVVALGDGSFAVQGSHRFAEESATPFAVTVDVTDIGGSTLTGIGLTSVTVNDAPLVDNSAPATFAGTEGASTAAATVATFTDGNTAAPTTDFNATIHWGDGQTSSGTIVSLGNGTFGIQGSHKYAEEGSFSVTADVVDVGGSSLTGIGLTTANIADAGLTDTSAPATVTGTEGATTASATVATFSDANTAAPATDFTATIQWGDGTSSSGTVVALGGGSFGIQGSHRYAEEGSFAVTADVADIGGSTLTTIGQTTAIIGDAQLNDTSTPATVVGTEGATTGNNTVATFADTNTAAPTTDFTATIHWGDGTTSSGTVVALGGGNFAVQGSHQYAEEGSFAVTADVADIGGSTLVGIGQTTASINDAPLGDSSTPATVTGSEGASTTNATVATFTDANIAAPASDFTATIHWGDGTTSSGLVVSLNNGSFAVQGRHAYAEEGTYQITADVVDVGGSQLSGIGLTTANINDLAVAATGGFTVSGIEGSMTGTQTLATFTDPAGAEPLTDYSASVDWGDGTTSAGNISFNSGTGVFTVTGSHVYGDEGPATITVTIHHDTAPDATVTSSANISEGDSLIATSTIGLTATEGTALTGVTVATFDDTLTTNSASDFTATIDWGDGTAADVGVVSGTSGHFTVTGSHTYLDEGNFTIRVTLTDDAPGTATASATANVHVAEGDVLTGSGTTLTATEGQAFTAKTVATFTDTNLSNVAGDFTASIDWGDNTTSTGVVTGSNGNFTVKGDHTYAEEGPFNVRVVIHDDGAGTATANATSTASVADAALMGTQTTVNAVEGTSFTGVVATFTDADPNGTATDYTATINWGDGTTSDTGVIGTGSAGGFTVTGTHTYADEGSFTISVTINDVGGSTTSVSSTAVVADAALSGTGSSIAATEGASFTGTVATFTDANPNGTVSDYSAMIDWGDGSAPTAGTITAGSGGTFSVAGTHTYAEEGSYTATITITDVGGATTAPTAVATVVDAPLTATGISANITTGLAVTNQALVTFTDAGGPEAVGNYTATIDWGDGTAPSAGTITLSGSTFTVAGSHVFTMAGTFTATVTILDEGGSTTSAQATLTTGTPDQRFIIQVYQDLLHRAPDPVGFQAWTAQLAQGASRSDVVISIEASTEYLTDVIQGYYHQYLRRDADPSGLQAFLQYLRCGGTFEGVQELIVSSPEYFQTWGGNTNDGFLDAVYQDVFHRAVDPSGRAAFDAALASGGTRQQVAEVIFSSTEYFQDLIQMDYQLYLNRAADPFGLNAFLSALQSGATDQQVVAAIMASPEFARNL